MPKEITIKLQQYVLNTENGIKKPHRGCRAGRSIKDGNPLRNMKLSKSQNSNSRINQTSKCSSVSIDDKTRPIVHNTYEWFTPRKRKQNRVKSSSNITNPITFSNRFSILLEPIDGLVQSQTTSVIANPPGGTIIHMSREPDSTTTLVGNTSGSLDGTIQTEDTDNAVAPHIDTDSSANYLYHSNIFTLCVGNVQSYRYRYHSNIFTICWKYNKHYNSLYT